MSKWLPDPQGDLDLVWEWFTEALDDNGTEIAYSESLRADLRYAVFRACEQYVMKVDERRAARPSSLEGDEKGVGRG